jgi:hypothetical protein
MSTSLPTNLPVALRTARRQFDRWRRRQPKRTRLPEELWQKAVALAGKHGRNKTASALGLKYHSLKKRIEATATGVSKSEKARSEFMELLPSSMAIPSIECTIELEDGGGTTVRMHVKGARIADLVSFACGFRSGRA